MTYQPKPAQLSLSHYWHIIGAGETGDGKSRFGRSMPGPRMWYDPTRGADYFVQEGDFVENSLNPNKFVDAFEWAIAASFRNEVHSLVVDDSTVIQDQFKYVVAGDVDKPSLDQWGPIKRPINRLLTKAAAAPLHIYITSRASMIGTEEQGGKIVNVYRTARPKCWDDWLYSCDFGLFFYSRGNELVPDKIKYYAQLQKTPGLEGFPLRPGQVFENPTFDSVFAEVLKLEAGAPPAVYDDPDAAMLAARGNNSSVDRVAREQLYEEVKRALAEAETLDALKAAWTRALPIGEWTQVQQRELEAAKAANKNYRRA